MNPLQFAVVREDPQLELALLGDLTDATALMIASGGCTGLAVAALRPQVRLTLLDANESQLKWVKSKHEGLLSYRQDSEERAHHFGLDHDDRTSLSGAGNFESLFRGLRHFIYEMVIPKHQLVDLLFRDTGLLLHRLRQSKYWPVAFSLYFSDALLVAMFGPDAIQHAPANSYPRYFQRAIETGLERADSATNGFLHHILLGHYTASSIPLFLRHPAGPLPTLLHTQIENVATFSPYQLISLSNLFDWMNEATVFGIAQRLNRECQPGARLLIRQLNNRAPVEKLLSGFDFDFARGETMLSQDRSLFYERILVGTKTGKS